MKHATIVGEAVPTQRVHDCGEINASGSSKVMDGGRGQQDSVSKDGEWEDTNTRRGEQPMIAPRLHAKILPRSYKSTCA